MSSSPAQSAAPQTGKLPDRCDVVIIGLGLMGSAALHSLRHRNCDVIGIDPLQIGEPRGSSHGSCRVFRRFNFESEAYTKLSQHAYEGWIALEKESGKRLLKPSSVLEAGPKGCKIVAKSRAFALRESSAIDGPRTGREANAAFPAFDLPDDWDVVVQQDGGILLAEDAARAFQQNVGESIFRTTGRFYLEASGVRIVTPQGDVLARQVIVTAGPWIAQLVPGLRPLLEITRQAVGWFKPAAAETTGYGSFPIFILELDKDNLIYGFPDFEERGIKAANHKHGATARADEWGPAATAAELEPVSATLKEFVPGAAGPLCDTDVCLYTNTRKADVREDEGEEFIIDRMPYDRRIIVASACSGHGAKFATAIGDLLANLALDPSFEAPPAFQLSRYSGFD